MKNLRLLLAVLVSAMVITLLMSCGAGKKASCEAYGQVNTEQGI